MRSAVIAECAYRVTRHEGILKISQDGVAVYTKDGILVHFEKYVPMEEAVFECAVRLEVYLRLQEALK